MVPWDLSNRNSYSYMEIKTSRDSDLVITTGYSNCRLWRETETGDSLTELLCLEEEDYYEFSQSCLQPPNLFLPIYPVLSKILRSTSELGLNALGKR